MIEKKNSYGFSRSHLKPKYNLASRLNVIIFAFKLIPVNKLKKFIFIIFSTFLNSTLSLLSIGFLIPIIYLALNPKDFYEKYGIFFPQLLNQNNHEITIILISLIFVFLAFIKFLYSLGHNFLTDTFTTNLEIELGYNILSKINKMPYLWTTSKNQLFFRDLALSRTSEWARGTIRVAINLLGDILFLLMAFIGILYTNLLFGLSIFLFVTTFTFIIWKFIQPKLLKLSADKIKFSRLSALAAIDVSAAGREIRFLGRENALLNDYKINHVRFGYSEIMARLYKLLPKDFIEFIAVIALASAVIVGMTDYIKFESFQDSLILIIILSLRALPLYSKIINAITAIENQRPNLSELKSFLEELKENLSTDQTTAINNFKKWSKISFVKASFLYEKNRGVNDINFEISHGEHICLVGDTGAGKTTILDMLCGLLIAQKGNVLVDNKTLTKNNCEAWKQNVMYVPQNPTMIDSTIEENILWGQNKVSGDGYDINYLLDNLYLSKFVKGLPYGLKTIIGDNGKQISGGQRQRIAIARAMCTPASLIILDEATNALDPITEKKIIQNLKSMINRKSSLVFISHRLKIVEAVDKVVFLKDGQLIKVGSHQSLYKDSIEYRNLYETSK